MSLDQQPPFDIAVFVEIGFSPEEIDALWTEVSDFELRQAREHGAEEVLARRGEEKP